MHPLLALALVILAGIGVTRLSRPAQRHPKVFDDLLATGAPFLLRIVIAQAVSQLRTSHFFLEFGARQDGR